MKVAVRWGVLTLTALPLACGTPGGTPDGSGQESGLPSVVATTNIICDLTRQLAGADVELTCLLDPGQDPHTYQPTPGDRAAIDDADLVLYSGYNLVPEIEQLVAASTSPTPRVAIFEVAVPIPLEVVGDRHSETDDAFHSNEAHNDHEDSHEDEHGDSHEDEHGHDEHDDSHEDEHGNSHEDEHGHDEHDDSHEDGHDNGHEASHEDEHGDSHAHSHNESGIDPHVWHSAANGASIVEAIATELSKVAPEQAETIDTNAQQLVDEFTALHDWILLQVATVPEDTRKLVTTHDAFAYFADAYGFEVAGALGGISPDETPSAARVAELVDLVNASGVTAVFAETTTNRNTMEVIARDAGVTLPSQSLFVDGPGGDDSSVSTYQQMLQENTCTIVTGLGGECQR
ncbi:MAG: zinc ABC transporter substrate-binding protein [Cyanobacteria bacterium J06597_1]